MESDDLFSDALVAMIRDMSEAELHHVAEVVRQDEQDVGLFR